MHAKRQKQEYTIRKPLFIFMRQKIGQLFTMQSI